MALILAREAEIISPSESVRLFGHTICVLDIYRNLYLSVVLFLLSVRNARGSTSRRINKRIKRTPAQRTDIFLALTPVMAENAPVNYLDLV